jgi:hypothetical protein
MTNIDNCQLYIYLKSAYSTKCSKAIRECEGEAVARVPDVEILKTGLPNIALQAGSKVY